ncbi:MAG: GHKL domain-containing protein [Lachnospira sp.]
MGQFDVMFIWNNILLGIMLSAVIGEILKKLFNVILSRQVKAIGIVLCIIIMIMLPYQNNYKKMIDVSCVLAIIYMCILLKELCTLVNMKNSYRKIVLLTYIFCSVFIMITFFVIESVKKELFLVIITILLSLVIIIKSMKYKENEMIRNLYKLQVDSINKQIDELMYAETELKKIKHDINSHLRILEEFLCTEYEDIDEFRKKQAQMKLYLKSSMGELDSYLDEVSTGNDVLDIIYRTRKKMCNSKNILFYATSVGDISNVFDTVDYVGLLTNLLDNAIEANDKITDDSAKRFVEITIESEKEHAVIKVSNPLPLGSKIESNSEWKTDKEDYRNHGYGTKIIKDIVRKYNGRIEYEIKDNMVECTVSI